MILYVHRMVIEYRDYGSPLGEQEGLAWSPDGDPAKRMGFERGEFQALFNSKLEKIGDAKVEIRRGEDIRRICDMNPHGLI